VEATNRDRAASPNCPQPPSSVEVDNLVGLALSGGGIRSASFNLGVLQALESRRALWMFDYLSTVSGGGFIGSWWSAWLSREPRDPQQIFPDREELEPQRRVDTARLLQPDGSSSAPPAVPDGALIARRADPIHFVRLFSNYLTPRTGLLSPDTWRLATFFVRNLLFTWMALLPLLLAAVMAGQLYFIHNQSVAGSFLCQTYGQAAPDLGALCRDYNLNPPHHPTLDRLFVFGRLALLPATAFATLGVLWLAHASAQPLLALGGSLVLVGVASRLASALNPSAGTALPWQVIVGVAVPLALHLWQAARGRARLLGGIAAPVDTAGAPVHATRADHRGWLSQQQATLLKSSTLIGGLLLIAGFGHDAVYYATQAVGDYTAKAGGAAAVLVTVASAVYTAIKAAPRTDGTPAPPPGAASRLVFAIAPVLVLLALTLLLAFVSRRLLLATMSHAAPAMLLAHAAVWIAALQVVFALFESWHDPTSDEAFSRPRGWMFLFEPRGWTQLAVGAALVTVWYYSRHVSWGERWTAVSTDLPSLVAIAILAVALAVSLAPGRYRVALGSARPVGLLVTASFTATLCLLANGGLAAQFERSTLLSGLLWIALLVGGVIAMGWLADPNLLSLHAFYKGRLSRAYLGASNTARETEGVTDSAPGDDLPLTSVWNHDAGAPYHLVNTTLSLVGGSDLATSQRSAENFILSRYHCGSARAGYRCTHQYMSGSLSLGTAAAISGAAASPTMGSQTPSAALSLLLALMNVRLGFWAPNPSGRRWDEPQARLWPLYLLRETLSNTGRLGTYCYLTDGGHFDNTGIYALVERGCRYIVVSDCGADPQSTFDDIGNAIRRCRIDFGTEIDLRVDRFLARDDATATGRTHVVIGTITYQADHLRMLGLDPAVVDGRIIWIKPTISAINAADVRQYKMANREFPQQSTANQWYDESQFESYRRLGYESALQAFDHQPPTPNDPGLGLPLPGRFDLVATWFHRRYDRQPA
jgi:hypothetical protein